MTEPRLLAAPPPVRRDRMVQAWIAVSAVSWLGSSAWTVALAWVAARTFPPAQAGLVVAVATIPQAVFTLPGGVVADRYDTRRVMAVGQVTNTAILLTAAALWGHVDSLGLLLSTGAGFGTVTGLTQPAGVTLARQLVATDDLGTVAGWNQVASRLARLAGAPLGAWLVTTRAGMPAVMVVDAATFLAATIVLLWVVHPRYELHDPHPEPWRAALGGGVRYLRQDRAALWFVAGLCGLNVFSTPLTSLGVPLRITASGWPATTLGTVEAVFSAAAIAGSRAAIAHKPRRPAVAAFWLLAVQGASYALVAANHRPALVAAMGLIGATAGCASVWLSAAFVTAVQPNYLGRVASLSTLGDLALTPVTTPAFGALTSHLGIDRSPWLLATAMVTLCTLIATRPTIRHSDANH